MKRFVPGLRARLLTGIVVTVPVVATILAMRFLFRTLDAGLGPWIADLVGRDVPGLGALATVILVLLVGVLATNFIGRRIIAIPERILTEVPIVRRIYSASKDIVESATMGRQRVFRDVVMVEYPRRGTYSYGFVTSYVTVRLAEGPVKLANVFVPGPPVPTSGNLVAVPLDELVYLDLSIEQALKLVLSAGITSPPELARRDPVGAPASEE